MKSSSQLFRWLIFIILILFVLTYIAPVEKSLGVNARIVYLHGAWVWAGLGSFAAAAIAGMAGLMFHSGRWYKWSRVIGLTALVFWLTYLPMSLLVMQMNWGGLYFDEPRWHIPFSFAITGVLLQIGLWLLDKPGITAFANILFAGALFRGLYGAVNVLHPDSPVFTSPSISIRLFFGMLVVLFFFTAGLFAAIIYRMDRKTA